MDKWIRFFALVVGFLFVVLGVMGMLYIGVQPPAAGEPVPMLNGQYGYLLGLFPVNVLHNALNLVIGIFGVIAYVRFDWARDFARVLTFFAALLTIMGLVPGLSMVFGLLPLFGNDIWLHLALTVLAGYFGYFAAPKFPTTATSAY